MLRYNQTSPAYDGQSTVQVKIITENAAWPSASFHPAGPHQYASSLISGAQAALIGLQLIELSPKWKSLAAVFNTSLHPI